MEWIRELGMPRRVLACVVLAGYFQVQAQTDSLMPDGLALDSLLHVSISSVAKYEQTTQEAPASVTIVTHEDIQNYGYNDVGELLNAVRDLYITFDRNYTYLGVRGFGRPTDYNNRVAVMLNGVVLNENLWGGAPVGTELYGIDIDNVERVEIIRGPASALYGNYPMLGMINIVMQTGKSFEGLKASAEYGSFNKLQASASFAKVTKGGLDLNFSTRLGQLDGQQLYYEAYDDSSTHFGVADKLDWCKWVGFHGRLAYRSWVVQGFMSGREIGVPTAAYGSQFGDPRFVVSDNYSFLETEWGKDVTDKTALFVKAWAYRFHDRGAYPLDSADGGLQDDGVNGFWVGGEARLRHDFNSSNRLVAGLDGQRVFQANYFINDENGVLYDHPQAYTTFAAYAQHEWQPFRQLAFTAGMRFDKLYLDKIALTPRFALNIFASKSATFKLLYGWAFRAPNAYEANIDDPTYIKGNLNLQPEIIRCLDLVYEQRIGKHQMVAASIYHQSILQVIDQVIDPEDSLLQFQNISNSGGLGGSVEWTGRFKHGFHAYGNYSFADMRNLDGDQWLTNSPRHMLKGGFSLQLLRHFRISPEIVTQSARLTVYDTETAPFVYLSTQLLFRPQFKGKTSPLNHFQLAFKVRNLLDADIRHPGGFEHEQESIRQNGRNFSLKLQWDL